MALKDRRKIQPPPHEIDFQDFKRSGILGLLNLQATPLSKDPPRQLLYILDHLEALGCKSVAFESHYVDRDYMDDHAIFYSKSLCAYPNFCVRAHFFRGAASEVENRLTMMIISAKDNGRSSFTKICKDFSKEHYLGFMVLKPLPGCPVGRTVLRSFTDETGAGTDHSFFDCLKSYKVHLVGAELEVMGLAFQQQDVGVSACATTAIWSAFQKIRDFEEAAAASPAQITMLAARYSLPFGRAMPSEGLSVDQMCLAVQALGASPHLLRARGYTTSRRYLYSITSSAMSSVLILRNCDDPNLHHAVSVAGMKCRKTLSSAEETDQSESLLEVFVHDDRWGPYVPAILEERANGGLALQLKIGGKEVAREKWELAHVLLPMHGKIRFSFPELWEITRGHLVPNARLIAKLILSISVKDAASVRFAIKIIRAQTYIENLLFHESESKIDLALTISRNIALSRYIGIVRLTASFMDSVDIVIDTTSTTKNPIFLAVVGLTNRSGCVTMARQLARDLNCEALSPGE